MMAAWKAFSKESQTRQLAEWAAHVSLAGLQAETPGVPGEGSCRALTLLSACPLLRLMWLLHPGARSVGRSVFNQSERGSVSEIRN